MNWKNKINQHPYNVKSATEFESHHHNTEATALRYEAEGTSSPSGNGGGIEAATRLFTGNDRHRSGPRFPP